MIAVGGLLLALICLAIVGLAAGLALAVATVTNRDLGWLLALARLLALALAAWSLVLAGLHQIAQALT